MPNSGPETEPTVGKKRSCTFTIFELMAKRPTNWIFSLALPVLWIVFISLGWSQDDIVETQVNSIWTRQRSSYREDLDYAAKYKQTSAGDTTSFAAMAVSRDGENIFTPERLTEIRLRMEETESITVLYKGITFHWDDICFSNNVGLGTTYKFPCARFSPMDYFQEARWFFHEEDRVTWYNQVARKLLVAPRIPRYGIMINECSSLIQPTGTTDDCNDIILKRMATNDQLLLFADIGNLEMNHPCKMCIEERIDGIMEQLFQDIVALFTHLLDALRENDNHTDLADTLNVIVTKLSLQSAIDFYNYMTIRKLYGQLGGPIYIESYKEFQTFCDLLYQDDSATQCPNVTVEEAILILEQHADHAYSSVCTAGTALPFFGDNGEGYLLQGNSPVSGSGIFLGGRPFSALEYINLTLTNNVTADPSDQEWQDLVESDPVYRWFIAGETEMWGKCGNGELNGTSGTSLDFLSKPLIQTATHPWCTKYNTPYDKFERRSQQHFARMWYDLLVDSPNFLGLVQGESDPYIWTLGQGCGYSLGGQRFSSNFTNDPELQDYLMGNASGQLYYIDEGEVLGPIDRNLLMGGLEPADYSPTNPLTKVQIAQSFYSALVPDGIVKRVQNCNRPGGPIEITVEDAEEVLYQFKKSFEETWSRGWDSTNTEDQVQFVGFFDDSGASGTTARMLQEITLNNGVLIAVSILIIAVFSVLFLFDSNPVESRIILTLIGVFLVILAFFAAVGFGIMLGIKVNINIAWTLPFIMLGLGVDDMYIVMLALKKESDYSFEAFLAAMKEIFIPVTMTSLVNAGMFAIMNINDIPAVYLTAQVAVISVVFLYLTIVFCFPAWCWYDMQRQAAGRHDVIRCRKSEEQQEKKDHWASFLFDRIYKPLILGSSSLRICAHAVIWICALALVAAGSYGLTERKVGLGLEDFFPADNQGSLWAHYHGQELSSWVVKMNWGALSYNNPETQMLMIQQFEKVIASKYVSNQDTKQLWMADFLIWTTRHCTSNFDREEPEVLACGRDQVFSDNSTCSGFWVENKLGLREKTFASDDPDVCFPYEDGICRPTFQMHPDDLEDLNSTLATKSWCPVIDWSDEKFSFCIQKWREINGGGGNLVLLNETGTSAECDGEFYNDEEVLIPIPISSSPDIFVSGLETHEVTLDMIKDTRRLCDDDDTTHCWLSGPPYDYWSQYIDIFSAFAEISGFSIAIGFAVAFSFLVLTFLIEKEHGVVKIICGSLFGAVLITVTNILSLVSVAGLSILSGVNLTGFSNMSLVLSVGFSVEYSVHIVARWLRANSNLTGISRVEHTMSFLMLPTFMSFLSSLIGVASLAFTEFEFNERFFFRPLILVMPITYFYGCWWLPVFLSCLNFDFVKMGKAESSNKQQDEEVPE